MNTPAIIITTQSDETGEFATVAIIPPGDKIRLNAIVKPTGYIKVAVLTYGSRDNIEGFTFEDTDRMVGDSLEMPVTWKGKASIPYKGKPVILRFQLKQAKLFGIEFYSTL